MHRARLRRTAWRRRSARHVRELTPGGAQASHKVRPAASAVVGERTGRADGKLAAAVAAAAARGVYTRAPDGVRAGCEQHGLHAHRLVQTLAPHIESARSELFDERETSSALINVDAREYVPLLTPMRFGVVRAVVLRAKVGERSRPAWCGGAATSSSCQSTTPSCSSRKMTGSCCCAGWCSNRKDSGATDLRAATGSTAGAPSAVDASNAIGTNDDSDLPRW